MYLNSTVMNIFLKIMQPWFEYMSFLKVADKHSESTFDWCLFNLILAKKLLQFSIHKMHDYLVMVEYSWMGLCIYSIYT